MEDKQNWRGWLFIDEISINTCLYQEWHRQVAIYMFLSSGRNPGDRELNKALHIERMKPNFHILRTSNHLKVY